MITKLWQLHLKGYLRFLGSIFLLVFLLGGSAFAATFTAKCQVDGDNDVDKLDIQLILAARNQPASGPNDSRDADGDGLITVNDARVCVLACTLPLCAVVSQVTVPDVTGLSQAEAEAAITAVGLTVGAVTSASSDTVPAGHVISQNPAAGTSVASGSAVDLVVSTGPAPVAVPNVVGLSQANAEPAITGAGLTVGAVTSASSDTVPAGHVISQNPTAGTAVAPGTSVDLVVSTGPALVAVPDVVGLSQTDAEVAIIGAGLVVGTVTTAHSDTVPAGHVISQNPAAGTSVASGSAVDLVVSTGPAAGPVPANLTLELSQSVIAAGGSIDVTPHVFDSSGVEIVPTPAINYAIVAATAQGTPPQMTGNLINTAADTRGSYQVQATVDGSTVSAEANFTVLADAVSAPQQGDFSNLVGAQSQLVSKMKALHDAVLNNDLPAIQALDSDIKAIRDSVDTDLLERSTAFAPEGGFPPTPDQLTAAGFPELPEDAAYGALVEALVTKMEEIITFYQTLDPASSTDDEARLAALNNELQDLVTQLQNANPTVHGVVKYAGWMNLLLGDALPKYLHTLVNRIDQALRDEGLVVMYRDVQKLYANAAPFGTGPARYYREVSPTFFGLVGLLAGSSIQVQLVQDIYGPAFTYLENAMITLAAHGLLQSYFNGGILHGIKTGASLSAHVFGASGSLIEMNGANEIPRRNLVFLVGPDAVNQVRSVLESIINLKDIRDLNDLREKLEAVIDALKGAGKEYRKARQFPDQVFNNCIFSSDSICSELVYNAGFKSVYHCSGFFCFSAPVLIMARNLDTDDWDFGLFNFLPAN
ncbi:PASTA domain-containing protein [Candidatus Parcubacteria bacterium]|nr:MAG: PASTA domain-containing protein [Candidatus Parcubacteria bacterium]